MADAATKLTGYQGVQNTNGDKTARGTTIVRNGNNLDENSFLKILTAELKNQDPDNAKDSTEYVAQMAQFAEVEQMSNLNNTMQFNAASSLTGKYVTTNSRDEKGNYYSGYVRNVVRDGSNIKITLEIGSGDNKTTKDFDYKDVYSIVDDRTTGLDDNSKFMLASSIIGKNVDALTVGDDGKTKTVSGVITKVTKGTDTILVNIHYTDKDGKAQDELVPYDYLTNVKNA